MDDDGPYLADVPETDKGPRRAGIDGLIDAEARNHVAPDPVRARTDIDDVGIRVGHIHGADGPGGKVPVRDRHPVAAIVGCLPHAAADGSHVEGGGLARPTRHRGDPPAPGWADAPVLQTAWAFNSDFGPGMDSATVTRMAAHKVFFMEYLAGLGIAKDDIGVSPGQPLGPERQQGPLQARI